ncbi:hypothetical protein BOTBODRAFT_33605 [Botryobasidium botryosum FD-172 SS1]|uniref:Uncharacterized protein n=1 Tax=Botryobasidium botryosum (strain FD-172 SS1) TaxID=930990 RepID=A0A067MBZ8_BOTB1|nr:hypothetical protein BOTBODRAFT_33605 [Botryobasidium botryosum FD-172 SS1]
MIKLIHMDHDCADSLAHTQPELHDHGTLRRLRTTTSPQLPPVPILDDRNDAEHQLEDDRVYAQQL